MNTLPEDYTPNNNKAKEERDRRDKKTIAAYKDFGQTPQGKLILEDLARYCKADQPSFVVDDPGGRLTAYAEGKRTLLLYIDKLTKRD